MAKQQLTIEIDVPDGFDAGPVEIYGYRDYSKVVVNYRKAWIWPSWLRAEWIAMSASGDWYAFSEEPQMLTGAHWTSRSFHMLDTSYVDFTPPPCTDWRQSKRRRPTNA